MLLMELQQYLLEHKPADWAVSLELISTKEAVEFYKKSMALRKDHVSGMSHKVRGTLVCEDRSGA